MDAAQMRNLMENYRNLKGGVEGCKEKIQRIRSWTFEEYIDANTHRSTLGESRLNSGKPINPTETLGMYGRKQFEQERGYELRSEQRRLAAKQALLCTFADWACHCVTLNAPSYIRRSQKRPGPQNLK